ncbi:hypothetical protein NQ318_022465 [Aromia moschata]|uniref:Uncharacterized protein n=1 Tax=Aromia moschata TaxID=1265417 RepID=A0AAV8Z5D7_9CUCU|nr:hypothetical protein NQ318_022465 [Aromia moschata]
MLKTSQLLIFFAGQEALKVISSLTYPIEMLVTKFIQNKSYSSKLWAALGRTIKVSGGCLKNQVHSDKFQLLKNRVLYEVWQLNNRTDAATSALRACRDKLEQNCVWLYFPHPELARQASGSLSLTENWAYATVPLEKRRTVNCEWHTSICLQKVFEERNKPNRRRRIGLHHNGGQQIGDFLSIDLVGPPRYSPDLALNNHFLFPHIKNKLRRRRFSSLEEAVDAFIRHGLEVLQLK